MRNVPLVMHRIAVPCCVLVGLLWATTARPAMRDALATAQLLSGLVETRLVRLEIPAAPGAEPRKIHSVVLIFDGVLWLYTPGLGTRPLGPAPRDEGRVTEEITARLRRLEPTLGRIDVYNRPLLPTSPPIADALSNACFAGCLYHLAELYARGESVDEAGIIFLSGEAARRPPTTSALRDVGHSLLVYRTGRQWTLLDPAHPETLLPFRPPQVEAEIDPALAAYARRANYPTDRFQYHRFSAQALTRFATEVAWRARRPLDSPDRGR